MKKAVDTFLMTQNFISFVSGERNLKTVNKVVVNKYSYHLNYN